MALAVPHRKIKTIVADEAVFPDYVMPKKTTGRKKPRSKRTNKP